ncbi:MAG: methyltransferase domain-containing protein [Richelia sp. RM2_1_2]|nr:methyltransferase domain-containing protein [Richelia sp. SM2_1_7]NJM17746.1 methyltransferase domain-containing protein [Richelia sp. SM1_7_0]NJN08243.1 methyltransferase domain-containing protein [Richelia sp. RM1_1_1]NJO28065.1 methyltransferase domain-containing protein [Richelia sp. SL_2_1]NJO61111.1 methyltransferase domain-containing protein [Richelia sp. RM2_1_2]
MIFLKRTIALFTIGVGLVSAGCTPTTNATTQGESIQAQAPTTSTPTPSAPLRSPDVVYVPTPNEVVDRMLTMANVGKDDVLYDLGSGDGRIPITAVQKRNARRAVGIEINPERIEEANKNAQQAGVTDRVTFLNQDLFESNFSDATVMTLYLLPSLNVKLRPQLFSQLKPGTRIVSHDFDMGEWKPERVEKVEVNGRTHTVYLWTVPENPPANLR